MNSQNLKQSRLDAGMTLRPVAKIVGCSAAYLSELENGKNKRPSADLLYDLSEVYGVRFSWLLGKTNSDGTPLLQAASPALEEMARLHGLSETEKSGLAQQSHRGRKPATVADYAFIWQAIGRSC